ncbi:helix-turn-helix domain-containing protein [Rhodococcus jostii]|uniref:helix-turn-helix domain-containing protein n=1 Tax=Rhodococcus jostii TaxID=132919 RepID=UPI003640C2B4
MHDRLFVARRRGGLLRTVLPEDARSGRYLSLRERERIAVLHAQRCSVREIARRLNRAPPADLTASAPVTTGICDAGLATLELLEQAHRCRRSIFTGDAMQERSLPLLVVTSKCLGSQGFIMTKEAL